MSTVDLVRELEDLDAHIAPMLARREELRNMISRALGLGFAPPRARAAKVSREVYRTVRERVRVALADGPMRASELPDVVGASYQAINSELSRGTRDGHFRRVGVGVYALPE